MIFNFDWFTNPETSRALATTFISALAGLGAAWLASRNVSRTIENQNKGLPPDILRLEKIQSIISKHEEPQGPFQDIDISDLKGEYEKSLRKLFLETKLDNIGVENDITRKKLLIISERPIVGSSKFPDFARISTGVEQKISIAAGAFFAILLTIFLFAAGIYSLILTPIELLSKSYENALRWFSISLFLFGLSWPFYSLARLGLRGWSINTLEADLIARNVYQLNSEIFTGKDEIIREDLEEFRKRTYFENTRSFQEWSNKNPGKSSWEYGLNSSHRFNELIPDNSIPEGYTVVKGRFFLPEVLSFSPSPVRWIGWRLKFWKSISLFPTGKKPQKISKIKNSDQSQ